MIRLPRARSAAWTALFFFAPALDACAGESARDLFRYAPEDAAVVVSCENLRERLPKALAESFVQKLLRLPDVQSKLGRAHLKDLERKLEQECGVSWNVLRDEIFGDDVLIASDLGSAGPRQANLIVLRARDPKSLARLLETTSASARKHGKIVAESERKHAGVSYRARELRIKERDADYLVEFENGLFAWSDSEAWIQQTIDAHSRVPAEAAPAQRTPRERVRADLPRTGLMSVYLDIDRCRKAFERRTTAPEPRALALAEWVLSGLRVLGISIGIDQGVVIRVCEYRDPVASHDDRKSESLELRSILHHLPANAVVVLAGRVDLAAVIDAAARLDLFSEKERRSLALLQNGLEGMLLGKDLKREILPAVGQVAIALAPGPAVGSPAAKPEHRAIALDWLGILTVKGDPGPDGALSAIENASRTLMALFAMSQGPVGDLAPPEMHTQDEGAARVTRFVGDAWREQPAFAVKPGVFAAGSSAAMVSEAIAKTPSRRAPSPATKFTETLRPLAFDRLEGLLFVNFEALAEPARRLQASGVTELEGVLSQSDLERFAAFTTLFETLVVTQTRSADGVVRMWELNLAAADDRKPHRKPEAGP